MLRQFSLALLTLIATSVPVTAEAASPNLLFIMADDCTFRDLGCYGGQAWTPNIDKLAATGLRIDD